MSGALAGLMFFLGACGAAKTAAPSGAPHTPPQRGPTTTFGGVSTTPNLLTNGSFEVNLAGWRPYVTNGRAIRFARTMRWASAGRAALRLAAVHGDSPTAGVAEAETAVRGLHPGCHYSLSSTVKVRVAGARGLHERVAWSPAATGPIQYSSAVPAKPGAVLTLTEDVTAPPRAVGAELLVGTVLGPGERADFDVDSVALVARCKPA